MMCAACNANYNQFINVTAEGTWQVHMNTEVCNRLMKDCYSYLNATAVEGRNLLDVIRMNKFQKAKDEIEARLEKLQDTIETEENSDAIVAAIAEYQTKLEETMRLTESDFQGDGAIAFRFGFKMPMNCNNETDCTWICDKMVQADGIAPEAVESDNNMDLEDITNSTGFETDIVPDAPVADFVDPVDETPARIL